MATTQDFVEFVCEQIHGTGAVRYRKMFGEYMVYVNDKPILLVADNTVYVKKLDCNVPMLELAEVGCPYTGAKEHYILDIENGDLARDVVATMEPVVPIPKKRKKKTDEAAD